MAFLSAMGSALGGMFGSGSAAGAGTLASSASAGAAAGTPVSGLMGGLTAGGGLSSMMESLPAGAGGGMGLFNNALSSFPNSQANNSFFGGLKGSTGLFDENGNFSSKNAGGLFGSLIGNSLVNGTSPQAAQLDMGSLPQAIQQALNEKPWATQNYKADSYINKLLRGL